MVNCLGCNKEPQPISVGEDPWGQGYILEDVWVENYEGWEPHVQAIKNEEGNLSLRFCYWKKNPDGSRGGFVNRTMFVYDETLEALRDEAKKHKADIILMLFKKLAE